MRDWIAKLDDFLRLSERDILTRAGEVSRDDAFAKAQLEYEKWRAQQAALPSPVEGHFDEAVKQIKRPEQTPPPKTPMSHEGGHKNRPRRGENCG